MLSKEYLKQVV